MADVVLSPLLQVVFEKLATPLLQEIADRCGLREEVKKLRRILITIQAVLQDAEEQQLTDVGLRLWLADLKQVAYDIEDLLDDFSPEAIMSGHTRRFTEQVRNFVPTLGQFLDSLDIMPRMTHIKETLELLAEERSSFHLRVGAVTQGSRSRIRRQTGSSLIQSEVVGREEDRKRLVDHLLSADGRTPGDVSVVSIVGLGGLGKTTLAQLVYNDDRVRGHFDLRMWTCINDVFDVEKVLMSIIESATKEKCDFSEMDVLQFRLQEVFFGKRYLLVLDDVWNEDEDEWDKLKTSLRSGMEGSTILVTTRSKKVASIMSTACIHHLEGLSEDHCWDLFKKRAFRHNEDHFTSLFRIGKQIVKKCGGVPLAAKTLGGLLRFKRDEREWLLVQESDLWDVCGSENGILSALRLSYSHLPSHLKACFAYCSIFPRNYIIKKEKLIQLWISTGLIQSAEGKKSLEFIGNEYFADLMWIFFFQDVQKGDRGNVTECKMHDLVHDLAQYVAGSEFVMLEKDRTAQDISQVRHASVVCNFSFHIIPEALYEAKKLRSLVLLFPKGDLGEVPPDLFSSFRYLRLLDLSGSGIKKLSESISSFIFLRYLDISDTHIRSLPNSVCSLCNLLVMNLSGCYDLIELPSDLARLSKLRHLIVKGCDRLSKIPEFVGKLVYLRTLSVFIVGVVEAESICQLESLNLGGHLSIRRLENVRDAAEAMKADLIGKRNLVSLALSWENSHSGQNVNSANDGEVEQVLNCLQPHEYLKRLSIQEYHGVHFPRWLHSKLPTLTELVLVNCRRCEYLPSLGQLLFLKVLCLQGMTAMKIIGVQFYGEVAETAFPSLEELTLVDFPNLESWWSFNRRNDFPSLTKLIVNKCPQLKSMPFFPCLQHLELHNCSSMLLRSTTELHSLTTLVIDEMSELVSLENLLQNNTLLMFLVISSCPRLCSISSSLEKLAKLKSLTVRWCDELCCLPQGLQNLTSLESLEIIECHRLVSLPEDIQHLRSLRSLSIENCNSLISLPLGFQFLTSLEHLNIMYCPKLAFFPDDFQHLRALRTLSILNCPMLSSLPESLQYVTTLQNLEIRSCPGLKALPDWLANLSLLRSLSLSECHNITSLPGGLQDLKSLQHLSIRECPSLEERCSSDIGEDWGIISHVAHIYIGSREPRQPNAASSSTH